MKPGLDHAYSLLRLPVSLLLVFHPKLDMHFSLCDFDSVHATGVSRHQNICQNAFNLDALGHSALSRVNTCLTSYWDGAEPQGIFPRLKRLGYSFFCLNPGCMPFIRGTKLRLGTDSLRNRTCCAGLRQGVGARNKVMPAPGYSVASSSSRTSNEFVSVVHAGGSALLCTFLALFFFRNQFTHIPLAAEHSFL